MAGVVKIAIEIHDHDQGSDKWFRSRMGKVTASKFKDVVTKPKERGANWSKTAESYMRILIAEIRTEMPTDQIKAKALDWGTEIEPKAASYYSLVEDVDLEVLGFAENSKVKGVGCSVDRAIGEDGLLEIKCPLSRAVHAGRLFSDDWKKEHIHQVQGQLWIMEREWCDLISFHPDYKSKDKMIRIRINRDQRFIDAMAARVVEFVQVLNENLERINGRVI